LMQKYNIPCARSASFSDYAQAKEYVKRQTPPVVIKADGLAAGKGVVVAESIEQALDALASFMESKTLGAAGEQVLIEEHLSGREMSAFAFTDGTTVVPMVPACDYKRIYDGDCGPNTGGMGSYSPPYFLSPQLPATRNVGQGNRHGTNGESFKPGGSALPGSALRWSDDYQ